MKSNLRPIPTQLVHRLPTGTWTLYTVNGIIMAYEELRNVWLELPVAAVLLAREEPK